MANVTAAVKLDIERIGPFADRCPVCRGRGMVPGWFYEALSAAVADIPPIEILKAAGDDLMVPETCRSCKGEGWVRVR